MAGALYAWRERETGLFFRPASLFSRFPAEDATALSIDVAALRRAGLLSSSKGTLEPEYQAFLDGTGFDYRRDLDLVAASFSRSGNYFIAHGRFDWNKLRDYAVKQGGSCYEQLCRMQGSQPDRHISFLPLQSDTMALAVGPDDLAASRLSRPGTPVSAELPSAPVWFSVPDSILRQPGAVPPGVRMMLSAMRGAERVVITMSPAVAGIEARLEINCRTQDEARILASQLRSTTAGLKEAMFKDTGPAAQEIRNDDLARMLASGLFEQSGTRVTGHWPVSKTLIDSLTFGI